MQKNRIERGFTLVELLVVVIIIGILAAIALPNFIGAQKKAKTAAVKGNMRTTQVAAESYATDSAGNYGLSNQIAPYYAGGAGIAGGAAGNFPTNPVTGITNEAPIPAGPTTTAGLTLQRTNAPSVHGNPGRHTYSRVDGGSSYAVSGIDADGITVTGVNGKVLVLSNQ